MSETSNHTDANAPAADVPRSRIRDVRWIILGLLLVAGGLALWQWWAARPVSAPAAQSIPLPPPAIIAETVSRDVQQSRERLAAVEAEIERLKAAAVQTANTAAAGEDATALVQLDSAIQGLAEGLAAVNTTLATLSARVTALEAVQAAQPFGSAAKRMAYALGLRELERAVNGAQPYAVELETLAKLLDTGVAEVAIAELSRHAASGVPTVAQLTARFDDAATAMVRADAAAHAETGMAGKAYGFLMSLVSIRPTGERAGTDAPARIARAQMRLGEGDLAAALAELDALDETAKTAAAAWITDAHARLAVNRALAELTAQLTAQLGAADAPARPVAPGEE